MHIHIYIGLGLGLGLSNTAGARHVPARAEARQFATMVATAHHRPKAKFT